MRRFYILPALILFGILVLAFYAFAQSPGINLPDYKSWPIQYQIVVRNVDRPDSLFDYYLDEKSRDVVVEIKERGKNEPDVIYWIHILEQNSSAKPIKGVVRVYWYDAEEKQYLLRGEAEADMEKFNHLF